MTSEIRLGKIRIGGGSPIVIQSMAKTDTRDVSNTVGQIKELEKAGCEVVRVAVKDAQAASAIKKIKEKINIPLVADIHFNYKLAIMAMENGADKIRLNPGNIYKEDEVLEIAKIAKEKKIPIRVGVNSGSVCRDKRQGARGKGGDLAGLMVKSALDYIKILEKARFYDIIVSLKAADVLVTLDAYRKFSKKSRYPLHLGITASGPVSSGLVKSSIGIGALLLEGIGDTIRVSLTGEACEEIVAARNILQTLHLRRFGPEIISCPTCGRCQLDMQRIVKDVEQHITHYTSHITRERYPKIAIMGCEVNGPGEARDADIGIAFGKGAGVVFENGKIVKRIKEGQAVDYLLRWLKVKGER